MRSIVSIVSVFALALSCLAASMQFGAQWQRFMPSMLGDARLASDLHFGTVTNMDFGVELPPGEHAGMTVTLWTRLTTVTGATLTNTQVAANLFFTPERVRRNNPSLAFCDAGGWPTNMTLAGTVTVAPFPFAPYDITPSVSNLWPHGVYTVAGESSNQVTVSVGGASMTVGPGTFNRNIIAGSGSACSVSGTGWARIGVARTHAAEFFTLDGIDTAGINMSPASMITNELKFIAIRLCLSDVEHKGCVDYYGVGGLLLAVTNSFTIPRRARALSSDGIYRVQIIGVMKQDRAYNNDFFDTRVFPRVLDDAEIDRIRLNGSDEFNRRGIPRWQ